MYYMALGFLGQVCYFGRQALQLIQTERTGKSHVPAGYWEMSLCGALLLGTYAVVGHDLIISFGQAVGALIYLRNLQLRYFPRSPRIGLHLRRVILIALILVELLLMYHAPSIHEDHMLVLLAGWIGQTLLLSRFPVQWYSLESDGKAELTTPFWWLSLFGALLILLYAGHRHDWVILMGSAFGLWTYIRNLYLRYLPKVEAS